METELIQRMSNDDMYNKTLIVRRSCGSAPSTIRCRGFSRRWPRVWQQAERKQRLTSPRPLVEVDAKECEFG